MSAIAYEQVLSRQRARGRRLAYEIERPYVSAHKGDPVAERMKRQMAEARARLAEGRLCAACPAAELLGASAAKGIAVRCGVERSLVTEKETPTSLVGFCLRPASEGGYTACPSWRAERDRRTAAPLVAASESEWGR